MQEVRDNDNWEEWILFILTGIEITAKGTIVMINKIKSLMMDYKHRIRVNCKFYSQDLINNLFCHPYTKIEFLEKDLKITRQTASKYLDELSDKGFLKKERIKNTNFYINKPLFNLFINNS